MKNTLKYLGLGFAGGMIPFAFGYLLSTHYNGSLSDQVIDGNRMNALKASYSGLPMNATSFVEASESTINSVVHVTTKVVRTQVQRDPFY
ncbi:MAG: hypothetical protein ACEQR5_08165, partial [Moraxellaceae bacterium]